MALNKDQLNTQAQQFRNNLHNGNKIEVHQLATVRANLAMVKGYNNHGEYLKVIEHAGKALEAIINYNKQTPTQDAIGLTYSKIKNIFEPIKQVLGKYGKKGEIESLIKEFVKEHDTYKKRSSGAREDDLEEELNLNLDEQQTFQTDKNQPLITQAYDIIKNDENNSYTINFLQKKGLMEALPLLINFDPYSLIEKTRERSDSLKNNPIRIPEAKKIETYLTEIITNEYSSPRSKNQELINKTKEELDLLEKRAESAIKDSYAFAGWFLGVVAGIGETFNQEDFTSYIGKIVSDMQK
ncbi:MAG: hypothetical protein ABIC91_00825 [Nanoarchaeota archaeon]|nr:hypothetical protein [Nanoarchaeota archaeon]MBU1029915.1 hypothetical protein [Nanoarchaeota archaeon]MBU1850523.1 hypothetical protein [Nanoarchaeota archaeon]